ncbi:hypothetical protein FRB98_004606, partial [Tulasnella sp. 332]
YQLLQSFTTVHQSHSETLTSFYARLSITKDHILSSLPSGTKVEDFLDTLVTFYSLHLHESKENETLKETLQQTATINSANILKVFKSVTSGRLREPLDDNEH